ncbi:hypothetical protein pb186bvf_017385 [Paramecium bursaria]
MQQIKDFLEKNKIVGVVALVGVALVGVKLLSGGEKEQQSLSRLDPSIQVIPLFDRLGGQHSVDAISSRFADLILNDKELKRLITQERKIFKSHVQKYCKGIFGGEKLELPDGKVLSEEEIRKIQELLRKAMDDMGIDKPEIADAQIALVTNY